MRAFLVGAIIGAAAWGYHTGFQSWNQVGFAGSICGVVGWLLRFIYEGEKARIEDPDRPPWTDA